MPLRIAGGPDHVLLQVKEVDGAPRVDCPKKKAQVLFSECQACEHGTVVQLKGARLPYLVCPGGEEPVRGALHVWAPDPVSSIMTKAVAVRQDVTIERLLRTFMDEEIGAAPVIDAQGTFVGLVTKNDLAFDDIGWTELRDAALSTWPEGGTHYADMMNEDELYLHELLWSRSVSDVMSRGGPWVRPDVTVSAAAEVMAMSGAHHLPVLGEGDRPVGMVSALELERWMGSQG